MGLIPYISKESKVVVTEVANAGASPSILLKNIRFAHSKKEEINHVTGDVHYLVFAFRNNSILTIHDVKSALHGNLVKKFYIRLFWFWLPALLVRRITVISDFTKSEVLHIIPFAKNKIKVVHNPVRKGLKASTYKFNTVKPQILFIGTKPNKNLERSFEAIKDIPCRAMIIGELTDDLIKLLKELQIEYENKFNLTFEEIVTCYRNCDLVCFASTYEGFGMPIIEAQAMGKPVVTSNIGAMLEVSDNYACMVNPYDVNSIREGVQKICNDEAYREQLIQNGFKNVKRFQPEYIAKQYIELYKEILT